MLPSRSTARWLQGLKKRGPANQRHQIDTRRGHVEAAGADVIDRVSGHCRRCDRGHRIDRSEGGGRGRKRLAGKAVTDYSQAGPIEPVIRPALDKDEESGRPET